MNTTHGNAKATLTSSWRPRSEVELIVGTPPGGGQDRPARAMMQIMQSQGSSKSR